MEIALALLLILPVLTTVGMARALGKALSRHGFWTAVAVCGMVCPAVAACLAGSIVVPEIVNPSDTLPDGIPPGAMLMFYALALLPISLVTSFVAVPRKVHDGS